MKIVTAGIIYNNGKILVAQRRHDKNMGLKWEFPGGKQEEGETLEQCLKREIQEEFHLDIEVEKFYMSSEYTYDFGSIKLQAFLATSRTQKIAYMDSHETFRWIDIDELNNFDFAPADKPIVSALQKNPPKISNNA